MKAHKRTSKKESGLLSTRFRIKPESQFLNSSKTTSFAHFCETTRQNQLSLKDSSGSSLLHTKVEHKKGDGTKASSLYEHACLWTKAVDFEPANALSGCDIQLPEFISVEDTNIPGELDHLWSIDHPDINVKKTDLLNMVTQLLVNSAMLKKEPEKSQFKLTFIQCAEVDAEFPLKVALYCRRQLNLRSVSNMLLAFACHESKCHKYVSKYFRAIVCLPSDWIEVADFVRSNQYNSCLPDTERSSKFHASSVLKRNMKAKFTDFTDYQLAKHNKHKSRSKKTSDRAPAITLKYLIRFLHISRPCSSVMGILGKRYPSSAYDFIRVGLEGVWNPDLAGKRMKLPTPYTWETELSEHGNQSQTWRDLVLSGKLPFMAMLRNLRNIIKCDPPEEVHAAVCNRLTNPRAVISSKQFPFRFYSAYATLKEMEKKLIFCNYLIRLKDMPKRTRMTLKRVPRKLRLMDFDDVEKLNYTTKTLNMYKSALTTALEIAIRNNLQPIRGNTLILCTELQEIVPDNKAKIQFRGMVRNPRAVGILLSLMCTSVCESCRVYVSQRNACEFVRLEDCLKMNLTKLRAVSNDSILERVYELCKMERSVATINVSSLVEEFYQTGQRFDNLLVIGPLLDPLIEFVDIYRARMGSINAIWNSISDHQKQHRPDWTIFKGPTDVVLQYLAETSNKGLLAHVERIDEVFGLDQIVKLRPEPSWYDSMRAPIERPLIEWQYCRVFISSTFRDMHAERDLLCGVIMPSIRTYAAQMWRMHVNEVDLRWGAPESATRNVQALQLCLQQAATAHLFILLVGNRYGWVPKAPLIDALPLPIKNLLKKFYKPGMSITEIEFNIMKHSIGSIKVDELSFSQHKKTEQLINKRILAFIRDPKSVDDIPDVHSCDFDEQHAAKRKRLENFKTVLKETGVVRLNNYPAAFNGVISGRPVMGNLDQLGKELNETILSSLSLLAAPSSVSDTSNSATLSSIPTHTVSIVEFLHRFVKPIAQSIAPRQLDSMEKAFSDLDARGRQCHQVRRMAASNAQQKQSTKSTSLTDNKCDGTILLVTGSPGCGMTTHLAALAMKLSNPSWHPMHRDVAENLISLSLKPSTGNGKPRVPNKVLPHFTDGLATVGLAPSTRLLALLDNWIEYLLSDLTPLTKSSDYLRNECHQIEKLIAETMSTGNNVGGPADILISVKSTIFSRLLQLVATLERIRYVFVLDAAHHLIPSVTDWLPAVLPENVLFVISCDAQSSFTRQLTNRADCLAHTITSLTLAERSAAIRILFGQYGKVLKESSFGNQLSVLLNKRNSDLPLYLRLACDEVRLYGSYEDLDYQLKSLPDTVDTLIRHVVARVEIESGSSLTRTALAFICCAQRSLSVNELHSLLDACLDEHKTPKTGSATISNRWRELSKLTWESTDSVQWMTLESTVEDLLSNKTQAKLLGLTTRMHLPPLAFYTLLGGLRPLLAGMASESDADPSVEDEEEPETSRNLPKGWLRFRSDKIASIVATILFPELQGTQSSYLSPSVLLGYTQGSGQVKRMKIDNREDGALFGKSAVDKCHIHWMLATHSSDLENIIYHLFHAGSLDLVCRLLISSTFILAKLRAGVGTSLLEDYRGYAAIGSDLHEKWFVIFQSSVFKEPLINVHTFVATHLHILSKYPFLFTQLAINEPFPTWIQRLGHVQWILNPPRADSNHLFVKGRIGKSDTSDELVRPMAVHHPLVSHDDDVPTALTVSSSGQLLSYGMSNGSVVVADASTFRPLRTFFGHQGPVLSCLFLSTEAGFSGNRSQISDFWLITTAQDASIYLWNISVSIDTNAKLQLFEGARLISLTGCHSRAVTSCTWHPDRRILATGCLDCTVILWDIPHSKAEITQIPLRNKSGLPNYRVLRPNCGPISSVHFRLPSLSRIQSTDTDQFACDTLAVGTWLGRICVYDLVNSRIIRNLHVSDAAVTSIAYSPNGGTTLAAQDTAGRLFLWNSDQYSLICRICARSESNIERPFDRLDCIHGHLCFSQPNGEHLIQSGGVSGKNGQINIWNAKVGSVLSPWRQGDFTICSAIDGVDPYGHYTAYGSDGGMVCVICNISGDLLATLISPSEKNLKIQTIACAAYPTLKCAQIAVGYINGAVRLFNVDCPSMGVSNPRSCTQCFSCNRHDTVFNPLDMEGGEVTLSHSGETLCLASYAQSNVFVSGGNDGTFTIHKVHKHKWHMICKHPRSLGSSVTAVGITSDLVAVGTKNGVVELFSYFVRPNLTIKPRTVIQKAANDWITALCFASSDQLLVGSNDHMVRLYSSLSESVPTLLQSVDGPGGAITSISAKAWFVAIGSYENNIHIRKFNSNKHLELISCFDSNSVYDGNEQVVNHSQMRIMNLRLLGVDESCSSPSDCTIEEEEQKDHDMEENEDTEELAHDEIASIDMEPVDDDGDKLVNELTTHETRYHPTSNFRNLIKSVVPVVPDDVSNNLVLLVGHERVLSKDDPDYKKCKTNLFYRLYDPFSLQLHSILEGHTGLISKHLASAPNAAHPSILGSTYSEGNSVLFSLAEQNKSNYIYTSDLGVDIRQWRLPDSGSRFEKLIDVHGGPVTCLAYTSSSTRKWFLSGGDDGVVILWHPYTLDDGLVINTLSGGAHPVENWKPMCRFEHGKHGEVLGPINTVKLFCGTSKSYVVVAASKSIFLFVLTEREMNYETSSNQIIDPSNVIIESRDFHSTVIDLCPITFLNDNRDSMRFHVSFADGSFALIDIPFCDPEPKKIFLDRAEISGHLWSSSWHEYGRNLASTINDAPVVTRLHDSSMQDKPTVERLNNLRLQRTLEIFSCVRSLEPVTSLPKYPDSQNFLLVANNARGDMLVLANENVGHIASSRLVPIPLTIVAACNLSPVVEGEISQTLLALMCTSDGTLHLFEYNPAKDETTLTQVGLYPTGERITKIQRLGTEPIQVAIGHQSGRISVYTII